MPQRALRLAVSKPYAHFADTCPCAKPTPNLSRHGRKLGFWQTSLRSFFKVPCPQTTTRLNSLALVSPAPPPPKINLTLPLFFSPWHSTRPCFHHPLPNDCVSGTAAPSNHHGRQGIFARPAPRLAHGVAVSAARSVRQSPTPNCSLPQRPFSTTKRPFVHSIAQ